MAVEDVSNYLGDQGVTPYDLIWARKDVLDYHKLYGMPAIIKRAYNSDHVAAGLGPQGEIVERDATFDEAYGQGFTDPTSAGQYGFSSGWFTYISLADNDIGYDPDDRGAYKQFRTSAEAPWAPSVWDGDLIILLEIQRTGNTIEIVGAGDRFFTQGIKPVSMRGEAPFYIPRQEQVFNFYQDHHRFIAQQFEVVRVPKYDEVYDIPVL